MATRSTIVKHPQRRYVSIFDIQDYQYDLRQNLLQLRTKFPNCETNKWGFVIVRCTYESQSRWDRFIARIHEDVHHSLLEYTYQGPPEYSPENEHEYKLKDNADLQRTFDCPLLEDEAHLKNATWKEARLKFEEWLCEWARTNPHGRGRRLGESQENSETTTYVSEIHDLFPYIGDYSPRWLLFIYADKTTVDSVVDCGETAEDKSADGAYFVTIVAVSNDLRDGECDPLDFGRRHVCEEDSDCVRMLYRRVRANKLVDFYGLVAHSDWDNDSLGPEDDKGILLCQ